MKKLIIFVLTIFLTFTIFITGKSANAQITEITPYYGGDILNGKEIYLFNQYSATPNFENGYLGKKTISQQDIYYQENSFYNGWYKDLGNQLIYDYIYPEITSDETFIFYIKFDNMLVQYLQLALISPEPMVNEYYIKFVGENAFNFMSTDGYNEYLITPPTSDMTKQVEWMAFDVGFPDYMASFRPLTAQTAYDFGFSAGESVGFTRGHNVGYNTGYQNGLQDAMEQGADVEYVQVQNYNQLLQYQNNQEDYTNVMFTEFANLYKVIVDVRQTPSVAVRYEVFRYENATIGHKYYLFGCPDGGSTNRYYLLDNRQETNQVDMGNGVIYTSNSTRVNAIINIGNQCPTGSYDFYAKIIDLTLMYGEGREPDLQTCQQIFNKTAIYPYSTGTIANVGYSNGYSDGYYEGIETGKNIQATTQLTSTGWIQSIFGGISSLLNIQILPGITIGIIVGIPFVISLAYFVIRAFRGGGGA